MRRPYDLCKAAVLAAGVLAVLHVATATPSQASDVVGQEHPSTPCARARVEFNLATGSLPHDPDAAYFGTRCRFGYPQECLRWCYAMQRINARFYAAQRNYQARCRNDAHDGAAGAATLDSATVAVATAEVDAITEACSVLDLNAIEGILLARRRRQPH